MGKNKKKKIKEVALHPLDAAADSLKKFRRVTKQIRKMSLGQKLLGGAALLAMALTYLAKYEDEQRTARASAEDEQPEPADAPSQEESAARRLAAAAAEAPAAPKKRKRPARPSE